MNTVKKSSVFDYNIAFLNLSEKDIADKTGISPKRVKEISEGAEPLLSELISLSISFDRSLSGLFSGEWFKHNFGKYYRAENDFLEQIVQNGNIRAVTTVFSSGFIVKKDDELKFVKFGKIVEGRGVDNDIARKAIKLLLEHGLAQIASQISTVKNYYAVTHLDRLTFADDILKKYLFSDGTGSWNAYFVPFFNGLEKEDDKRRLISMVCKNLKEYTKHDCLVGGGGKNPYLYYIREKNGIKEISTGWYKCDFSILDIDTSLIKEAKQIQEKIFGRSLHKNA